jgi:hypothetical protein
MEQLDEKGKYPKTGMILRVRQITFQAVGINSYELVHPENKDLPPFTRRRAYRFPFPRRQRKTVLICATTPASATDT